MIGLVIVAHAPVATALLACVEHVFGAAPDVVALDIPPKADATPTIELIAAAARKADRGDGVLMLTDLFGATPANLCNKAIAPLGQAGVRCVLLAGANAPMLLRAVTYRHLPLDEVVQRALSGGTQGVMRVGSSAPQNQQLKKGEDALARYQHQQ